MAKKRRQSPLEKSISAAWNKVPARQRKKLIRVRDAIIHQKNDVKRIRILVDIVSNAPDAGRSFVRGTGALSMAYISALASGFRRSHKSEYDLLQGLAYAPKFVFQACAAVSAADEYYSAISAGRTQARRIKGSILSLEKECRRARRLTVLQRNAVQMRRLEQRINALKSSYRQLQKQYVKTGRQVKPVRSARELYNAVHRNLDRKGKEIKALELRIASLDVAYNRLEDSYESAVRRIRRGTSRRAYARRAAPRAAPRRRAPARQRRAPAARPARAAPRHYRRDTNLRRQYNGLNRQYEAAQEELTRKQAEIQRLDRDNQNLTYKNDLLRNEQESLERTSNKAAQRTTADLAEKDRKYNELERDLQDTVNGADAEIRRISNAIIAPLRTENDQLYDDKARLTGEKGQLSTEKQTLADCIASLTSAHKKMQEFYALAETNVPADLNVAVENYEKARKELQDHQDRFPDRKYEPFERMIGLITRRVGDAYYCMARNADGAPDANRVELYRKALAAYDKAICDAETTERVNDCRAQVPAAPAQPPVPPAPGTPPPVQPAQPAPGRILTPEEEQTLLDAIDGMPTDPLRQEPI
jgi:predicted  nucleic acid-binding Zn-ribbon protein